jgi:predicted nucleotidyltransferase component of viral defense system
LLPLAQSKGQDYQRALGRYAIERFLYRLGSSTYRDRFAIKGATLFTLWTGDTHRPTKDLDLLGWGSSAIREVEEAIRAICKVEGNYSILFGGESVEGTRIKEEDEYEGVRVKFHAVLAGARIPMQVDIGFGDAVYPEPQFASFPVLLPMEPPVIRAYPREGAIAEKLNAMVVLDIRNSRMKDFYDIWFMANTWTFEIATLRDAIRASFERRGAGRKQVNNLVTAAQEHEAQEQVELREERRGGRAGATLLCGSSRPVAYRGFTPSQPPPAFQGCSDIILRL